MKSLLPLFLLLLAAAPDLALAQAESPASSGKPDVLVILTDQWSPRYVSWDNPQVRTPHLDRLAKEGMIFDACYTPSPVCLPARVSIITGLYPHNEGHSLWGNATGYFLRPEAAPMFRDIKRAGYTTAQIGKLHWTSGPVWKEHFPNTGAYHEALGLDQVLDVPGPPDSPSDRNIYGRYLSERGLLEGAAKDIRRRYVLWEFEPRASVLPVADYHDVFVTSQAVKHIQGHPRDKPLCLVVSLHSPHPPLDAPGDYATMYDPASLTLPANVPESFKRESLTLDHAQMRKILANYLGKMSLVDDCVGRLAAAFSERGTWKDALVIFTADHGEMMGAHGAMTKGRFYEESVRVPFFIRWPGRVKSGRTAAPVQSMDLYPTIVEAIGGELTPGRFAKSLLPIATGARPSVRPIAVSEIGSAPPLRIMARHDRYKYWADETSEALYDLEKDPLEMNNLAASAEHAATLSLMRQSLLTHLRSTQVNHSEGYKSKVRRLREAEAKAGTSKKSE